MVIARREAVKSRIVAFGFASVLAVSVAGCATEQGQRAATGGLIGAGAGALVGQAVGRDTGSTLAGAAGGAILGAVVGSATAPQSSRYYCRYQRSDGSIYTAPC
jgi:uncharacterized protein YcfJ